ncbi:MAG: 2-C-methyl-D-erythritol 4-phosphate cytidylyltransferase [Chlamydiales bacterium]|nr:2-C-methyl-D-erythritol 4-phosphate cytidylyltransferase [Chlamydiales bacterium]
MKISVILLAGGKGSRMGTALPKQFLLLDERPIACRSLEIFLNHSAVSEVIVVCASAYRPFFSGYDVQFANPGERRQDSLFNGLAFARHEWVCVHDAARPYLTRELLTRLIDEGKEIGAATLAMPVKNTVKESDESGFVRSTPDREYIWEVQTPQLLTKEVLLKGFAYADKHGLTVTDDVSLAELIGHPVKLVPGSYENIKITTPEDLCQNIGLPSLTMGLTM